MDEVAPDLPQTRALLDRVRAGDRQAREELLAGHRELLREYVERRADPSVQARFDPSDVVQEAQLEISRRLDDYLERRPMPFHLWVRRTARENLVRLWRRHARADRRSVGREVPLPERSSVLIARRVLAGSPSPSQQVVSEEQAQRVRAALARLPEVDREILLLRTFEGLSNQEVAQVLGLDPDAASKRYGRALLRLSKALKQDGLTDSRA